MNRPQTIPVTGPLGEEMHLDPDENFEVAIAADKPTD